MSNLRSCSWLVTCAVAGMALLLCVPAGATSPGANGAVVAVFTYSPDSDPGPTAPIPPQGLMRVPLDGSRRVRVLPNASGTGGPVAFTPDGRSLLVKLDDFDFEYIDLNGHVLRRISLPFSPTGFSPNGASIVGIGRPSVADPSLSTVYVARSDGSHPAVVMVARNALLGVTWSARNQIAVTQVGYRGGTATSGEIDLLDPQGHLRRVFRPGSKGCRWTRPGDPDWSPAGRLLVFAAAAHGCSAGEVFTLDTVTGRSRLLRLALHPRVPAHSPLPRVLYGGQPTFSPDGKSLLIYTGGPGLFLVHADGTHPVLLADDSSVPHPPAQFDGYGPVLEPALWQPEPS